MNEANFVKYLSVDYGRSRIGLAMGGIFPSGGGVVHFKDEESVLKEIAETCLSEHIDEIVVGLPLRSQGEPGTLDKEIRDFAQKLANVTHLAIYFEPEQFTSAEAERLLKSKSGIIQRKSGEIDEMAAILILEQFLVRKEKCPPASADIRPKK